MINWPREGEAESEARETCGGDGTIAFPPEPRRAGNGRAVGADHFVAGWL